DSVQRLKRGGSVLFNRYYQEELSFLREEGAAFSKANAVLARFLAGPSRDPDVERLLEGFAFLAGRIREKLDDEFPEIIETLLGILWPEMMRPSPSASILQLTPIPGRVTSKTPVPKGVAVQADVDGVPYRFQTSFWVDLYPMGIDRVSIEETAGGQVLR